MELSSEDADDHRKYLKKLLYIQYEYFISLLEKQSDETKASVDAILQSPIQKILPTKRKAFFYVRDLSAERVK